MPNVVQLITKDHREVETMFTQFEQTGDFQLAQTICQELTVHAEAEESAVYPTLEDVDPEIAQEAQKEHDEAKELIAKIQSMSPDSAELKPTMLKLKEAIQHHVEEEESEALPKLEQEQGGQLDELGTRFQEQKEQLLASGAGVAGTATSDMTKQELYEEAKAADIPGRSQMNKDELAEAVQENQ